MGPGGSIFHIYKTRKPIFMPQRKLPVHNWGISMSFQCQTAFTYAIRWMQWHMQRRDCLFFFPPMRQRPRKSRCKKDWKIIKGFLFSSDKQSIELRKLHNRIFAASAECFIIRKCDSSLEKQQAKPKWIGGKKPSKRFTLILTRGNKLLIKSCCHVVTIFLTACCHFPPQNTYKSRL